MIAARDQLIQPHKKVQHLSWKLIAFYLGIPLAIAINGAINNWEIQQTVGYYGTLLFYLSHAFVPWWITSASTYTLMLLLQSWQPKPWLLMTTGAFAGCLLTIPYTNWVTEAFEQIWPMQSFDGYTTHVFSTDFFIFYLRVVAIWVAVNLIFDRYVGLPRYRYDATHPSPAIATAATHLETQPAVANPSTEPANQPAFLARLPETITMDQVLAVSAEQHYIRVHTSKKDYMILYRFSDAVREIDGPLGMQVHRSWWIAKSAITSMHYGTKKFYVQLENGAAAPVSTPYQGMLREIARTANIPLRPAPGKSAAH